MQNLLKISEQMLQKHFGEGFVDINFLVPPHLTVMKWSQHTSNLQEGNAVVSCIPASRRLSIAVKLLVSLREPLEVRQHTIVSISRLRGKS